MKSVLIFTESFYPAYKAGGPVQSITNLIISLKDDYEFYVITSAYDLQSQETLDDINVDCWNKVLLPKSDKEVNVWYAKKLNPKLSNQLVKKIKVDKYYINGIFSIQFFLFPIISLQALKCKDKIIICPRGMLQKGALAGKYFKKKIYLIILRLLRLVQNVQWHATSVEESSDVINQFGIKSKIVIAPNIPKTPIKNIVFLPKVSGNIQLIYLSLITEKKNLKFLLEIIIKATKNITLDIYGPVKDINYWKECELLINKMPNVKYCGDVLPTNVQKVIAQYHASILLTKGENFGHALYESLSVGRPIVTSEYTPWINLKEKKAGWNANILNVNDCVNLLDQIAGLDQNEYNAYCNGAFTEALGYFDTSANLQKYKTLFST